MTDAHPPRDASDDYSLVRAVENGDRAAAEQLVDDTYRQTYRSLYRLCGGNVELAEDLTQDTYRRAWTSLTSFEGRCRLTTWLFRIAYNAFLNHARRPHRVVSLPAGLEQSLTEDAEGPERFLLRGEAALQVRQAVLKLPQPLQFAVTARFWGELPLREIARAESVSTVAVHKRLRKALRILGDALEVVR